MSTHQTCSEFVKYEPSKQAVSAFGQQPNLSHVLLFTVIQQMPSATAWNWMGNVTMDNEQYKITIFKRMYLYHSVSNSQKSTEKIAT